MSDVTGTQAPDEQYTSQIDPAFSAAWNAIYDPETPEAAGEGGTTADPAASRTPAPAPAEQGAGAEPGAGEPPAGGAQPDPAPAGEPAEGTGVVDAEGGPAPDYTGSVSYDSVAPQFAVASEQINERMERTFFAQAAGEVQASIDPRYMEALQKHPLQLVDEEVPSVKGEGMTRLRDSREAKEWQEATAGLIKQQIETVAAEKVQNVRPMMGVIQESVLMFQNNPDLVPNTDRYDPELAKRFTSIAKNYELRIGGKLYGYQVNVQPLINSLREDIAKTRGASGERTAQEARSAQQRQAVATQPRTAQGQFDSPQAGLPSKSGMSGDESEDFSVFWDAVHMPNQSI